MTVVLVPMLVAAVAAALLALLRPQAFLVFLLAAGTLRFGADAGEFVGGAADLSAAWLLVLLGLTVVALLRTGRPRPLLSGPELAYALFLGWCVIECARADHLLFSLRLFLKLLFPPLVMMLARATVRDGGAVLRCAPWVAGAALASWLLVGTPAILLLPQLLNAVGAFFWTGAAYADHAALMVVLSLVLWRCVGQTRYLLLAACLATPSVAGGVRTGVMATAIGIGLFALLEWRHRALPLLLVLYLGTAAILFSVPQFREKMFVKGREVGAVQVILSPGKVDSGSINDSGRFTMWGATLGRFFRNNPAVGSGLGATQAWFYSGGYGRMRVEHSEYVRLLSDTGVIGLGLYVGAMAVSMIAAGRVYWRAPSRAARYAGMLAVVSFPVAMVCMAFDNVLNYALPAGQYPLAFTGVALGLAKSAAARRAAVAAARNTTAVAGQCDLPPVEAAPWGRQPLSFNGWDRQERLPPPISG